MLIRVRFGSHADVQPRNRFIEIALAYAMTYVSAQERTSIRPASIIILADTDYYSSPSRPSTQIVTGHPRFHDFNVPLSEAHKTGLGSSAALVTAFTAAVLAHYLPASRISLNIDPGKALLHGLAQVAHCAAQGKVGSGFDVAAAVYGTCVYKRFSPSILEDLGEIGTHGFSNRLQSLVGNGDRSSVWDMVIDKSKAVIPSGIRLVMCDVDCGSETVGMAKKVLAWKDSNVEASAILWGSLQKANDDLAEELWNLSQNPIRTSNDYQQLRKLFLIIRSLIREMSRKAEVPIEPKAQTDLLDACCQVSGVLGGVVPGAGGYDAIALLVEDQEEVLGALNSLLGTYGTKEGYGNEPRINRARLLGVKQDMEGLKKENVAIYSDWTR